MEEEGLLLARHGCSRDARQDAAKKGIEKEKEEEQGRRLSLVQCSQLCFLLPIGFGNKNQLDLELEFVFQPKFDLNLLADFCSY
jgi:hypothetical protein